MKKVGIFLCQCEYHQISQTDLKKILDQLKQEEDIVYIEPNSQICHSQSSDELKNKISEYQLTGIVLSSCMPVLHEKYLHIVSEKIGMSEDAIQIIEMPKSNNGHKLEFAGRLVSEILGGVHKIGSDERSLTKPDKMTKKVMIIGAGVAGIHVALDVADAGYQVYLLDRSSSIGGHMVQMSEVFPTLDCPQCILTPKMVACYQHPNINIMAYSEIEQITGQVGDFKVTVKHKTPYIDWDKCTGCGECNQVCTVSYPSEFDRWVVDQHATFKPFAQAVPNKFVIQKKGQSPCKHACPIDCNAQGYVALISKGHFQEAISLVRETIPFPGVLGRVCNHNCQNHCLRSNLDEPVAIKFLKRYISDWEMKNNLRPIPKPESYHKEKFAIIGAGPAGLTAAYDLAKQGYKSTIFEALPEPGGMLKWGIPDYRLPSDILNYEIDLVREMGAEIKCNTRIGDEIGLNDLFKKDYKAIFLAPGAHKSIKLGIEGEDADGVMDCTKFLRDINMKTEVKLGQRVGIIGGGNAAIDAARTAKRLGCENISIIYRRTRAEMPADKAEVDAADHEGIDIQILTSPKRIIVENNKITGIECVRNELGEPDASGRRRPVPIPDSEFVIELDNLIPAISQAPDLSFLPKNHPFKISKWNTFIVDEKTMATNVPGVFAGGDAVTGPKTVVEAMQAGHVAAEMMLKYLHGEELKYEAKEELPVVEDVDYLKSHAELKPVPMPELEPAQRVSDFVEVELGFTEEQAKAEAERCLACGGCSECRYCETACEAEAINQNIKDRYEIVDVGSIVVATGYELLPRAEFKEFELDPDIMDPIQFERLLAPGGPTSGEIYRPSDGKVPKTLVFISCTGSRDPERHLPYCSRVCCMYSLKMSMLYKHAVHDGQAFIFYMDVRCDGKMYEEFYQRGTEEDGIVYLRGQVSKVFRRGENIVVWGTDTISGQQIEVEADIVVLALAMVARPETQRIANMLGIELNQWGFLQELHPRLKPVETKVPGVFIAGTAQAPKDIPECVAHANGCAGKVLSLFGRYPDDEMLLEEVEEETVGCAIVRNWNPDET